MVIHDCKYLYSDVILKIWTARRPVQFALGTPILKCSSATAPNAALLRMMPLHFTTLRPNLWTARPRVHLALDALTTQIGRRRLQTVLARLQCCSQWLLSTFSFLQFELRRKRILLARLLCSLEFWSLPLLFTTLRPIATKCNVRALAAYYEELKLHSCEFQCDGQNQKRHDTNLWPHKGPRVARGRFGALRQGPNLKAYS